MCVCVYTHTHTHTHTHTRAHTHTHTHRDRQGCCLSPILFNLYSESLPKEALDGLGDFIGVQIIQTVKYADDLVLMAKECYRA